MKGKSNEVCKIALREFEKCLYYMSTFVLVSSLAECTQLIVSLLLGISLSLNLPTNTILASKQSALFLPLVLSTENIFRTSVTSTFWETYTILILRISVWEIIWHRNGCCSCIEFVLLLHKIVLLVRNLLTALHHDGTGVIEVFLRYRAQTGYQLHVVVSGLKGGWWPQACGRCCLCRYLERGSVSLN